MQNSQQNPNLRYKKEAAKLVGWQVRWFHICAMSFTQNQACKVSMQLVRILRSSM